MGGAGDDQVLISSDDIANLTTLRGGDGTDTLSLSGDMSGRLNLDMRDFEKVVVAGGFDCTLDLGAVKVSSGKVLLIDASALTATDVLTVGGTAVDGAVSIIAGAGDDLIDGGHQNDVFDLSTGGKDSVNGGEGDDTFVLGQALTASDSIDGGLGADTVELNGDYGFSTLFMSAATMIGVERLLLDAGHSYKLATDNSCVEINATLEVDASALTSGQSLAFDGSAETDGHLNIKAGAGDDVIQGGDASDTIHLEAGGTDRLAANGGDDLIYVGASLGSGDQIGGGNGADTVELDGDYAGVHAADLSGVLFEIERLRLDGGHSYELTLDENDLPIVTPLEVDATGLAASQHLSLDGSAVTSGHFLVKDGAGADSILAGQASDTIGISTGGADTVQAGGGNDTIQAGAAFGAGDQIDGGSGVDALVLDGDYSSGLTFGATALTSIELITLTAGHSYDLTLDPANVGAGGTLTIDGAALGADDQMLIDGSDVNFAGLHLTGGEGDDALTGAKNLTDTLTGGGGSDTFGFAEVAGSTSRDCDIITDLDLDTDRFHFGGVTVQGVDAIVTTGDISYGTFDADLAAAIGPGQLAAGHAVLFLPDTGDLVGHAYLVVDANGQAGYQAGADYVVDVGGTFTGTLDIGDFV